MAQILSTYPTVGERIGTGLGKGLQLLAQEKLKDYGQQQQEKRNLSRWQQQADIKAEAKEEEQAPYSKDVLEKAFSPELAEQISSLPSKNLQRDYIKSLNNKGSQNKIFSNFTRRVEKATSEEFPETKSRFTNMSHTLYEELEKKGADNATSVNYIMNLMDKLHPLIKKNKSKKVTAQLVDKLSMELGDEDLIRAVLNAGGYELT